MKAPLKGVFLFYQKYISNDSLFTISKGIAQKFELISFFARNSFSFGGNIFGADV